MKTRLYLQIPIICACLVIGAATVNAQATRTWVSGVGDDVNPCSRTAPCKTFAGAISKTAEGGEIDALDPAGYGTVTITKAMTLDGGTGSGWASILSAGVPSGVIVNITTGTHVSDAYCILRNITFNGAKQSPTTGALNGVNYIKGAQLSVEKCVFEHLGGTGITMASMATSANLRVNDSYFDDVNTSFLITTSSGAAAAHIDNCRLNGGTDGLNTTTNAFVTMRNCNFAQTTGGSNGAARSAPGCAVNVVNSTFASNALGANAAGGALRLSNDEFFNNTTAIAGTAESANNNKFRGNGADGSVSNVIVVK